MIRLDDLGASSKQHERWSRHRWANVWPLHDRRLFGAWGPYREMTAGELERVFALVADAKQQLTVAITACWVERDGTLVPYPKKFPRQAEVLKAAVQSGTFIPACHGLTHCHVGAHRPRWIGGNRPQHREDWTRWRNAWWWPPAIVSLEAWLGQRVTVIVPPGLRCPQTMQMKLRAEGYTVIDRPDPYTVFHDRDFVCDPTAWERFEATLCTSS